ncbi:MAG: 4Fe-4S binding protein [Bacteroidales bacterium]|nr:4Fe-4S binding protein [Bacteroidales bacterium]
MERDIVKINEDLCDGCGLCIPNCHEGALQIIDNKAVLVSDLMCDGLGACIGHCPQGAITIEKREAQPYNEVEVIKEMVKKGENTVIAHLIHLKEHNEIGLFQQGIEYLEQNRAKLPFNLDEVKVEVHNSSSSHSCGGACPGSAEKVFNVSKLSEVSADVPSQLTHWPVQLHLANPASGFFKNSDVVIAADCSAFTYGNFHEKFIKGKSLVIACPKLDSGLEIYISKITRLIDEALVNTITVVIMEVPCCGGLLQIVKNAASQASRKVPIKLVVIGIQGEIVEETWV